MHTCLNLGEGVQSLRITPDRVGCGLVRRGARLGDGEQQRCQHLSWKSGAGNSHVKEGQELAFLTADTLSAHYVCVCVQSSEAKPFTASSFDYHNHPIFRFYYCI